MWEAFKQLIFAALLQIQGVVGDWGLAIVVLTVLFRLVLIPLTVKQTKSMFEMQRIQPKIKELQKKYADDKEKLQEETLKFYQENKVNPFGGCLPALLQMPLFIALYSVLGQPNKGKGGILITHLTNHHEVGRFFSIIPDISKSPAMIYKDPSLIHMSNPFLAVLPYAILVVLFGLSIWLPQALMPGEKQQKMIGLYMGVMMLFFGWSAPAGVLLYWDVSSIWAVAQQQIMLATLKHDEPGELVVEAPAKEPKNPEKPKQASGQKKRKRK